MSTTFYDLRAPVTSVRIEQSARNRENYLVSFWFAGQLAGRLVAREAELPALKDMLRGEKLFIRQASASGPVYTWYTSEQAGRVQVIDEYGDLHDFPLEGMA